MYSGNAAVYRGERERERLRLRRERLPTVRPRRVK
jgi:hypothetical protein